jgi:hypothetical protein
MNIHLGRNMQERAETNSVIRGYLREDTRKETDVRKQSVYIWQRNAIAKKPGHE